LSGRTFILEIHGSLFEVKSTSSDAHLGGEDFDIVFICRRVLRPTLTCLSLL
ncbi:hypothetical protein CYLTODRAFT_362697, partial [Cylindrobasidium torrendii FP15055 ss-10]